MVTRRMNNSTMKMNKTVWSILSLTTFSVLLIAITFKALKLLLDCIIGSCKQER